jgi:hypothetical protein
MPNGGDDCCGTCWFNRKNKGELGYRHAFAPEDSYCTIRDLNIEIPFYTYCSNHPRCNPTKIEIPVGPVYAYYGSQYFDGRRFILVESDDTEELRQQLIGLIPALQYPEEDFCDGIPINQALLQQLTSFRETRAIPGLKKLLHRKDLHIKIRDLIWNALRELELVEQENKKEAAEKMDKEFSSSQESYRICLNRIKELTERINKLEEHTKRFDDVFSKQSITHISMFMTLLKFFKEVYDWTGVEQFKDELIKMLRGKQ